MLRKIPVPLLRVKDKSKKKKESKIYITWYIMLLFLIIITVFSTIVMINSITHYSKSCNINSFYHINIIRSVKEQGFRVYDAKNKAFFMITDLATGNSIIVNPGFYYFFAFIDKIANLDYYDYIIINKVIYIVLSILFYLISYNIIKRYINAKVSPWFSSLCSLICSLIFFFTPYMFSQSVLFSPILAVIIMTTLIFYIFSFNTNFNINKLGKGVEKRDQINNGKKKDIIMYIIAVLLILTSPYAIFISSAFLFYLILNHVDGHKTTKRELDFVIFFFLLSFWFNLILYGPAIRLQSFRVVWQNLPIELIYNYFRGVNVVSLSINVGVLLVLVGIISAYLKYFVNAENKDREKTHQSYQTSLSRFFNLNISLFMISLGCALFRIIKFDHLMFFLSFVFALCTPFFVGESLVYLKKTKLSKIRIPIVFIVLILLLLNNIGSSYSLLKSRSNMMLNKAEVKDLKAINKAINKLINKTNVKDANEIRVLTIPEEGPLFHYFTSFRVVSDGNYISVKNPDKLYQDIKDAYTLYSLFDVLSIMERYKISHIYFSNRTSNKFGITKLTVTEEKDSKKCVQDIYKGKMFEVRCRLKKIILGKGLNKSK